MAERTDRGRLFQRDGAQEWNALVWSHWTGSKQYCIRLTKLARHEYNTWPGSGHIQWLGLSAAWKKKAPPLSYTSGGVFFLPCFVWIWRSRFWWSGIQGTAISLLLCAICSQQVGCHGSPSFSILCHSETVIIWYFCPFLDVIRPHCSRSPPSSSIIYPSLYQQSLYPISSYYMSKILTFPFFDSIW